MQRSSLAMLLLCAVPTPAAAQACYPLAALQAGLAESHGERPAGAGASERAAILLLANPETGTFTVVMIPAERQDIGCLIASGGGWHAVTAPPRPAGRPS